VVETDIVPKGNHHDVGWTKFVSCHNITRRHHPEHLDFKYHSRESLKTGRVVMNFSGTGQFTFEMLWNSLASHGVVICWGVIISFAVVLHTWLSSCYFDIHLADTIFSRMCSWLIFFYRWLNKPNLFSDLKCNHLSSLQATTRPVTAMPTVTLAGTNKSGFPVYP